MNKIIPISIIWILLLSGVGVATVTTMKVSTENYPPEKPVISGPSHITAGDEYIYGFETTDPEGNDVYYFVDWGDGTYSGWIGPYYSGTEAAAHHTYAVKGTITIHAKAKDNYSAESDWATYIPQWRNDISQQINVLLYNLITSHPIIIRENQ
ncbi:MAG TPA: hypothetical protein VMT57_03920 [Candidatus Thermoplasmatota archaeon]|nr:hypothetical protein [Candidatus Thermoplasmatota archaeon]